MSVGMWENEKEEKWNEPATNKMSVFVRATQCI